MPIVTITEVENLPLGGTPLAGAHLDVPSGGYSSDLHAFPVRGWAVAAHSPVTQVELVGELAVYGRAVGGTPRRDVAAHIDVEGAASPGFSSMISTLGLPETFELFVRARLEDGTRHTFAVVRGRTSYAHAEANGDPVPVLVITHGRTGSTWLMRLLESHPAIVAYKPFDYELRVISYWTKALLALGSPTSYLQVLGARLSSDRWWLGDGGSLGVRPDAPLSSALGRESVDRLVEFGRSRVRETYAALAEASNKPDYKLFAEKVPPERPVVEATSWMHPGAKRIYLFRDPRDMALSILAYNERTNTVDFGRERVRSDEEFLEEVEKSVAQLLELHDNDASPSSLLVRYEDLIRDSHRALSRMFSGLGVDASEEAVRDVIDRASAELPRMKHHRTAPDSRSSVGRWHRDLSPAQQELWTDKFERVLDALGYEGAVAP